MNKFIAITVDDHLGVMSYLIEAKDLDTANRMWMNEEVPGVEGPYDGAYILRETDARELAKEILSY